MDGVITKTALKTAFQQRIHSLTRVFAMCRFCVSAADRSIFTIICSRWLTRARSHHATLPFSSFCSAFNFSTVLPGLLKSIPRNNRSSIGIGICGTVVPFSEESRLIPSVYNAQTVWRLRGLRRLSWDCCCRDRQNIEIRVAHANDIPRTTIQRVPSGLGSLRFGCSTMLPTCLANSAQFQSAQSELGRQ